MSDSEGGSKKETSAALSKHHIAVNKERGSNAAGVFIRFGHRLTKRLMFYLSPLDAGYLTSTCKWLSFLRGPSPDLIHNNSFGDPFLSDPCVHLLYDLRLSAVSSSDDNSLQKDFVFEPQFTSLFHSEIVGSELVFLSAYNSRIFVWEIVRRKCRVCLSLPGIDTVLSHAVTDNAIATLGATTLALNVVHWKSKSIDEKLSFKHEFEASEKLGLVQLLCGAKFVVTSRRERVSVFNAELQPLWERKLDVKGSFSNVPSAFLVPSATRPYVLLLFPMQYRIYDAAADCVVASKRLRFSVICQSGILSVSCDFEEKYYLVILGYIAGESVLFANGSVLSKNVKVFGIHGNRIVCQTSTSDFLVFEANIKHVQLVRTVKFPEMKIDQFQPFPDIMIAVKSTKVQSCNETPASESDLCRVSYLYRKSVAHVEILNNIIAVSVCLFRGYIVVVGKYKDLIDCVTVVRYFQDGSGENNTALVKYLEYKEKEEAYYRVKINEKTSKERHAREKANKKRDREKIPEWMINKIDYEWKKLQKLRKENLRLEIRDEMRLLKY